jgi:hypothetical protein
MLQNDLQVNGCAASQPPARGGFIKIYRDDLHALYQNKSAALAMLWLQAHAAFSHQDVIRRGELIKLAPGECVFSLGDLQKSLGLTHKEVRCALDYLYKHDLIRIVTTKNYSKAIFREAGAWGTCEKYMCRNLHKREGTKRGMVQGTVQGMDQGTDEGTLSDKNNDVISGSYDENKNLMGTDQGTVQGTVQGMDQGKAGAHIGPETPGPPALPAPNNTKELITKKKESLSSSDEAEREEFFSRFKDKKKSIEEQFQRQFKIRVEIKSDLQIKAALGMLFQARRLGKQFSSPAGLFTHLSSGSGSLVIPDEDWDPCESVRAPSFSPPREIAELSRAAAEKTSPERLAEIKKEIAAKRKAAEACSISPEACSISPEACSITAR